MLWHKLPQSIYFRRGCLKEALKDLEGRKRALIVTDAYLFNHGHADELIEHLKRQGLEVETFFQVEPDPTLSTVRKCAAVAVSFRPDVIVAFGGGSPMDAAKIAWILYEHPDTDFHSMAMRFMDLIARASGRRRRAAASWSGSPFA